MKKQIYVRVLSAASLLVAAGFGMADDSWTKLRDLDHGTELRVYKKAAKQPLLVRLDSSKEDSLIVFTKDEQSSIPKTEIVRVDYRPTKSRVSRENRTKTTLPAEQGRPNIGTGAPTTSTSSGISIGNRPEFETIYLRVDTK